MEHFEKNIETAFRILKAINLGSVNEIFDSLIALDQKHP